MCCSLDEKKIKKGHGRKMDISDDGVEIVDVNVKKSKTGTELLNQMRTIVLRMRQMCISEELMSSGKKKKDEKHKLGKIIMLKL